MSLSNWVAAARSKKASDLHLEPGMPTILRVNGRLEPLGQPVPAAALLGAARELIGEAHWPDFLARRSFDLSAVISGTRCRINVLKTARGVGMAVRLLSSFRPTLSKLNLHPDLAGLAQLNHGLVIISGATGSGKSTTLAALLHEVSTSQAKHIVTIEQPIEYALPSRRSLVRQREVGRDTPSFEQALLDCLREDPDVIVVGEMREPEVMRLTLNAAETGHLVFATMHSSSGVEAIGRLISAFPAEMQNGVASQLAECLQAVVCQRLTFDGRHRARLPVCEVIVATHAVKGLIRKQEAFRISSAIETGRDEGMWSFERYQRWLDNRTEIVVPSAQESAPDDLRPVDLPSSATVPPPLPVDYAVVQSVGPPAHIAAPPPQIIPQVPIPPGAAPGLERGEVDDLISQLQRGPRKPGDR